MDHKREHRTPPLARVMGVGRQQQVINKYILSILRKLTVDEPKKWSTHIPSVVMAINSSVSETTKFSPFYLTHGVHMRDISYLQLPYIPKNIATNKEQAYAFWSDNLIKIRKYAKDNISKAKAIQKKNYDKSTKKSSVQGW